MTIKYRLGHLARFYEANRAVGHTELVRTALRHWPGPQRPGLLAHSLAFGEQIRSSDPVGSPLRNAVLVPFSILDEFRGPLIMDNHAIWLLAKEALELIQALEEQISALKNKTE